MVDYVMRECVLVLAVILVTLVKVPLMFFFQLEFYKFYEICIKLKSGLIFFLISWLWMLKYSKFVMCFFFPVPPSPCAIAPCINGGTCITKTVSAYKCVCRHGYHGENCEGMIKFVGLV